MKILVTGEAGFIGFSLATRLLKRNHTVIGVDNLEPCYRLSIKRKEYQKLTGYPGIQIQNRKVYEKKFQKNLNAILTK